MRTLPTAVSTFLAGPSVTMALLVKITRSDDTVYRFTSHTENLTYQKESYLAGHISLSKLSWRDDLDPDSIDIAALLSSAGITEDAAQRRLLSYSNIIIRLVDYTDTSTQLIVFTGRLGKVTIEEGALKIEAKSKRRDLQRKITKLYSPTCRAVFGDSQCGIDLDTDNDANSNAIRLTCTVGTVTSKTQFTITGTGVDRSSESGTITPVTITSTNIGAVAPSGDVDGYFYSSDGWTGISGGSFMSGQTITVSGFTATANNGTWRIINTGTVGANSVIYVVGESQSKMYPVASSTGDSVTISIDASYTPSGYFSHGKIVWFRGQNSNRTSDILKYTANGDGTGSIVLSVPPAFTPVAGDQGYLYGGCDKRRGTCINKYDNVLNFRGEPDLPGMDNVNKYPDRMPVEVDYT